MPSAKTERLWDDLHGSLEMRKNLPAEIKNSWDRCYQMGVNPRTQKPLVFYQPETLPQAKYHFLIETSPPIWESLINLLAPEHAVLLFDNNACVLRVLARENEKEKVNEAGLGEGMVWSEEVAGTNAASLGLNLAKPIAVVGCEHFCRFGIPYACAFAPIIDQHELIGGLAVLGPAEDYSPNILGLAMMAAQYIVSLVAGDRWNAIINESITEGVLVIDHQDHVVYINKSCHRILKFPIQPTFLMPLRAIIDINQPDNHYFWSILSHGHVINDESVALMVGKERIHCIVNITPINLPDRGLSEGKIIVFQETERINRLIRGYVGNGARITFDDIIGNDPGLLEVKNYAMLAASFNSNILLLGESGTGKDVFAQAIHNASSRRNGPFLAINCAALPRELIASELFGYDEGAFTGARKGGNIGKFELADQGTIFLDEIGDMPLDLQALLLRVIEEKTVTRLGGTKAIPVNVRIIAATNKDVESEVALNRFRSDLYYRLGVIRINIPPLRERPEDIICLAKHFTKVLSRRLNKPERTLSPEALEHFLNYSWPGNVRELQNVLEGAIQMSVGSVVGPNLFSQYLGPLNRNPETALPYDVPAPDQSQKQKIMYYLRKYDNNKSKTARALNISRKTLYKQLKDYNITSEF